MPLNSWTHNTQCTLYRQLKKNIINIISSHILINAPKQYIFNFLNEIKLFNKL